MTIEPNESSVGHPTVNEDALVTLFITFGLKYKQEPHPEVGHINPDGYVKVTAKTHEEALEIVRRHFGIFYAFDYTVERFAKSRHYYPLGELCAIDATTDKISATQMHQFAADAYARKAGD